MRKCDICGKFRRPEMIEQITNFQHSEDGPVKHWQCLACSENYNAIIDVEGIE